MKTFLYTYESTYTNKTVQETYSIKANSTDEADYEMGFGCGDLITKHNEDLGRLESMKLINVKVQ